MPDITYRAMRPGESASVSALVLAAFEQYIAPEYTPQGIEEFRKYAGAAEIRERLAKGHFVLVASTDDGLAGMIEIRQNNHVALLFVAGAFHRQGVARALLDHGLATAREQDPDVERVTVNSTRYGVPAYQRLGFRQTGPERAVNGIVFIPMAMRLKIPS
jgi:GNAT superfamily N-acetyltransferase